MNKQTFISIVALLAAPTLLIGGLRGTGIFDSGGTEPNVVQPSATQAKPLADNTSADERIDMTSRVTNAKMDLTYGWYQNPAGGNFGPLNIPAEAKGEATTTRMWEHWWAGGLPEGQAIYQELSNLPNGKYQLRMAAMITQGGTNPQAFVYANDAETKVTSASLAYYTVEGEVTDHTLSLGLRIKAGNNGQWSAVTDISLTYLDGQRGILRDTYNEAQTAYEASGTTDEELESLLATTETLLANESATTAECMTAGETLEAALHDFRVAHSTAEQPYDMTYLLENPTFGAAHNQGWTQEGYSGEGGYPKYGAGAIEYWHCTFDLHQTVANLPDGQYRVSAQLAAETTGNVWLYAAESTANPTTNPVAGDLIATSNRFSADRESDRVAVELTLLEGELKLGIRTNVLNNWIVFDDFRLEYLGEDVEVYATEVALLLEEARGMQDNEMPASVKANLEAAIAATDALASGSTAADYRTALAALRTSIEEVESLSQLYPAYLEMLTECQHLLDITTDNEARRAFETAMQASAERVAAAEDAFVYRDETAVLDEARQAFIAAGPALIEGEGIDMTELLANPTFDAANTNGWTQEGYAGEPNYPKYGAGAIEYWHCTFDLHQTVTGLRDGLYRVSVQLAATIPSNVQLYADDLSANAARQLIEGTDNLTGTGDRFAANREADRASVEVLVLDGELRLGMRTSALDTWIVFDDFRLEFLGETMEMYAEEVARLTEKANGMQDYHAPVLTKVRLDEALAAAGALTPESGMEAYKEAIPSLRDAVELVETAHALYPAYGNMLAICQTMLDATADNEARRTLEAALQASAERIANATDGNIYTAEAATLDEARRDFMAAGPAVIEGKSIDITYLLANPTFDAGNTEGWAIEGYSGEGGYPKFGAGCAEFWHSTFDLNQTVTGLPQGQYRVSAQVGATEYHKVWVYANDLATTPNAYAITGANLTAVGEFFQENRDHERYGVEVTVLDGNLRLGLRTDALDNWIVFDDFRLEYLGESVTAYAEELARLAEEGQGMLTHNAPAQVKATLEEALAAANGMTAENTMEEYKAAILDLTDAMAQMESSDWQYPAYADMLAACQALLDATNDNEARRTFEAAMQASAERLGDTADGNAYETETAVLDEARRAFVAAGPDVAEGQSIDLTFMVQNPEGNSKDGWNQGKDGGNFQPMTNAEKDGQYAGSFLEKWDQALNYRGGERPVYQAVGGMPVGVYTLRAAAFRTNQSGETPYYSMQLFCNDGAKLVKGDRLDYVTTYGQVGAADNNTVTIGLQATLDNQANWCGIADVTLLYWGASKSAYEAYRQDVAQELEEATGTIELTEGFRQAAAQALADNAASETDDAETLKTKITELENALQTAYEAIVPTEAYQAAKQATSALADYSDGGDRETFEQDIESYYDLAEAATTRAELEDIPAKLEACRQMYMLSGARPLNGTRFDLSFAINGDFSQGTAGWLTELPVIGGENLGTLTNGEVNGQYAGTFIERYYTTDARLQEAAGTRAIYQAVSGMPAGMYALEAAAFARRANIGDATRTAGMTTFYLNGEETDVTGTQLDYMSFYDVMCWDGNLEFGLRTEEGSTLNWLGLADVHLYYYGIPEATLDTEKTNPAAWGDTYRNVTLENEFDTEHWNTLCLPFDLAAATAYFDEVREITGMELDGTTCRLTTATVTDIKAGMPYLVKVKDGNDMAFGTTLLLSAAPQAVTFTEGDVTLTFKGLHRPGTLTANMYACEEDYFVRPASTDGLSFRAYLTLEGGTTEYERILFDVGAEDEEQLPTSINGIEAAADEPVDVYSTGGVLLKKQVRRADALKGLPAGLYIVDGEKIAK